MTREVVASDAGAWTGEPRGHSVTSARPSRVRTALISADYDAGMHGWIAHADNRVCRVAWTSEGTASLFMPWEELSGA
jgi:hypothetical protein